MSAIELREWMVFSQREPIGYARDDFNAGMVASVIATVNSRSKRFKPIDFMPYQTMLDDTDPAVIKARSFMREFSKSTAGMNVRTIRRRAT